MKVAATFRRLVVCLAVLGTCVPGVAFAASPQAPVVTDVKLQEGGLLVGQVVNGQGVAVAGMPISLQNNGKELAAGTTNPEGAFAFSGLKMGVYQVAAGETAGTYRVWNGQAAPPAAQQGALLVVGDNVVRGQYRAGQFLTHPLVIGAGVAAAIAIPVAIATNDDDDPASN